MITRILDNINRGKINNLQDIARYVRIFLCFIMYEKRKKYMYCTNCGKEMNDIQDVCLNCGVKKGVAKQYCYNCGTQINNMQSFCVNCGVSLDVAPMNNSYNNQAYYPNQKSRLAAGLFALFLGAWGVHNFYLGNTSRAVIQLVVTIVGILLSFIGIGLFAVLGMSVWALVEGIFILSRHEGYDVDSDGVPLKE